MKDSLLNFILNNWVEISKVYNIEDSVVDYLEDITIPYKDFIKGSYWTCFYPPIIIKDLYSLNNIGVKNIIFKLNDLKLNPGYIYNFEILNHHFSVLYKNIDEMYYIDYYEETNRGSNLDRPNSFRLEKMDKNKLIRYIYSYLKRDFHSHALFHYGDKDYENSYKEIFNKTIEEFGENSEYTNIEVNIYEITNNPTIFTLLDLIQQRIKDIDLEVLDGKINKERAKEIINFHFKNLITNSHKLYMNSNII